MRFPKRHDYPSVSWTKVEFYLRPLAFSGKVQRNVCRTVKQLPWKMVPRGGFEPPTRGFSVRRR
ncbi:hypothetical protein BQ8482_110916 [Mesorhizobium delmotii]|uniref:Uncharacterized protein n=1 Tax=Mesorhizobium delmotii TaxID=1631247 RepID=A0A2P9AD06_9HYPH|nr:hypothetical protein BQ8482_110916 [Mesorhizobium delmotii]